MNKAYVFLKRGWVTFASYRVEFVLQYVGLFVTVATFYLLSGMLKGTNVPALAKYGGDYTRFIIIGVVFQWFVTASLNSFSSSIRTEQMMGTIEFLLMSNTRLSTILFYSALWNFTRLLANTIIIFIISVLIFKVHLSLNLFPAFLILLLTVTSLSGIGMMSAGMIIASKQGDPINWVFATLSTILSGVFFPVEVLPSFLKSIATVLPTTHALSALRQTLILNGTLDATIAPITALTLFSLIAIPIGLLLFRWGFNKARATGSLVEY
ncbi:MAG: ABC transporter permease [Bacteroidota bacterium]